MERKGIGGKRDRPGNEGGLILRSPGPGIFTRSRCGTEVPSKRQHLQVPVSDSCVCVCVCSEVVGSVFVCGCERESRSSQ